MKGIGNQNRKFFIAAALLFLCSTLFFAKTNFVSSLTVGWIDEEELGEMCIKQVVPTASYNETGSNNEKTAENNTTKDDTNQDITEKIEDVKEEAEKSEEKIVTTGKPLVIIYHTHSSESYMPYKESNYHREAEKGTVRDVGNVLESTLEKKGINVIHDKTLHDRPSYNESYNRSLETITALRSKYPTADYVIDLHRDAAPASASEGKVLEIDGKRVAKFSLVVGKQNENYIELYGFAKKVSEKAGSMYSGFGGAIIEQNYKYNEYVSDKSLLLEIGNNKNTIEESRLCGAYFAEVLAEIIKEEQ